MMIPWSSICLQYGLRKGSQIAARSSARSGHRSAFVWNS